MISTANPWDDEYDPNDDPMCGFDDDYGNEPSEVETDPQYGSIDRWTY